MGNNHDQYFGNDKRKILLLGAPSSGKTQMLEFLTNGKEGHHKNQKTKDLIIKDAKVGPLTVTFFKLSGGERQKIFWKQHYEGTQGIIFLIDCLASEDSVKNSMEEIKKFQKNQNLVGIPIALCFHKSDLISFPQYQNKQKNANESLKKSKIKSRVFDTSVKQSGKIKDMISWLLQETKPL